MFTFSRSLTACRPLRFICLFAVLFAPVSRVSADAAPKVVLKLDDMMRKSGGVPVEWSRVHAFLKERGLPMSVGIIGKSLEGDAPEYFETLKAWAAGGGVELWNHGYDHRQWMQGDVRLREFSGSGREHQAGHLEKTQRLGEQKLGVRFVSFGAGFNSTDEDTVAVLAERDDIRVWLYGRRDQPAGKAVLARNHKINLEHQTGRLDLELFKQAYLSNPTGELLVLQGHPMMWDDAEFTVFTRIVDFLQAQGATFALPRDCVEVTAGEGGR